MLYKFKWSLTPPLKPLLSFILWFICGLITFKSKAEDVVIGCINCYSSMHLIHRTFRELFPDKNPKWILFQSHDYSPSQERYLAAFPKENVLKRVRLSPLEGGV